MIESIVNKFDLIYRMVGLSQAIGLGLTTLLSYPSMAATTNYVAAQLHVSKDIFGALALALGLLVVARRWSFTMFALFMSPLILYTFANARYVYVAGLSPTVPSLLLLAGVIIMLGMRYGIEPLK